MSLSFSFFFWAKAFSDELALLRDFVSPAKNILIIQYIANTQLNLAIARFTRLSDNIPARSLIPLIHRLVRLQLTSPLAYIIAQLLEPFFFRFDSPKLVRYSTVVSYNKHRFITSHIRNKHCTNDFSFTLT